MIAKGTGQQDSRIEWPPAEPCRALRGSAVRGLKHVAKQHQAYQMASLLVQWRCSVRHFHFAQGGHLSSTPLVPPLLVTDVTVGCGQRFHRVNLDDIQHSKIETVTELTVNASMIQDPDHAACSIHHLSSIVHRPSSIVRRPSSINISYMIQICCVCSARSAGAGTW